MACPLPTTRPAGQGGGRGVKIDHQIGLYRASIKREQLSIE
jgi:hypothetical protein